MKKRKTITDKERLDWLNDQPLHFQKNGVYFRCGDYYDLSHPLKSVRDCIDTAIRAQEKRS